MKKAGFRSLQNNISRDESILRLVFLSGINFSCFSVRLAAIAKRNWHSKR